MKQKLLEKALIKKCKAKKEIQIASQVLDNILILDIYEKRQYLGRYGLNTKTGEYGTYRDGKHRSASIRSFFLKDSSYYYRMYDIYKKTHFEDKESVKEVLDGLDGVRYQRSLLEQICDIERNFNYEKAEAREKKRYQKVEDVMKLMPAIPKKLIGWIDKTALGGEFLLYDRKKQELFCTACGEVIEGEYKSGDTIKCPHCKKKLTVNLRKGKLDVRTHFAMLQPVNDEFSVMRHFDADILANCGNSGRKKIVSVDESVRILLYKNSKDKKCKLYWSQSSHSQNMYYPYTGIFSSSFDEKKGGYYSTRQIFPGYLYPENIEACLKGTAYEGYSRIFKLLADNKVNAGYNNAMCCKSDRYPLVLEMLYKNGFKTLLEETMSSVSVWDGMYRGPLDVTKTTITDIFGMDKQTINRLKTLDGGSNLMAILKYGITEKKKISDAFIAFTEKNSLYLTDYYGCSDIRTILSFMNPDQAMNYLNRQHKESYSDLSMKGVVGQYNDYISLCKRLEKHLDDEMVYRPRELKRRHDEAVAAANERKMELDAQEYIDNFPEAENVLREIREKYEYENETFAILVPNGIIDIIKEGRNLHHCVGATNRYVDRIQNHETYICFLRKKIAISESFYTIEVEPGGVIRQHRGFNDEEPELDTVLPFLKEWQKEIRKRMAAKDHLLAKKSKDKRLANIEDLRQKQNIRVLKALEEDFMDITA